jgi:hypothetical protein
MEESDIHEQAFNEPDKNDLLYSRARDNLIKDTAIQEETRERERCEFWVMDKKEKNYEEPIGFSVSDNELYVQERPPIEEFTEEEYRVVNGIDESDCSSCNGDGIHCPECNDTGEVSCSCRTGYKWKKCSNCDGSGKVEVYDSNLDKRNIECGDCDGSGRRKSVHSKCEGRGGFDCQKCLAGNRDIECEDCKGAGTVELINATKTEFKVRQNETKNVPSSIKEADHYLMNSPPDRYWETVHQEIYNGIPESEDAENKPDENLLLPVPNGEKVKVRYTKETITYQKVDLTLRTSDLVGSYDDEQNKVEHTIWKPKEHSRVINKIDASRVGNIDYVLAVLWNFAFVGLWGGSIVTLILMLPIAAVNDYIITIPEALLGLIAVVIFVFINLLVMWEVITTGRYRFKS